MVVQLHEDRWNLIIIRIHINLITEKAMVHAIKDKQR